MEENLLEVNKNRIVLTNFDISSLVTQTPFRIAFDKMQMASSVSGKLQYWIYRLQKKIIELFNNTDSKRITLAKKFCEKEEDGSFIFLDSQYQFDPEQKELYDKELEARSKTFGVEANKKEIAEKYCKRDEKGKPIKVGGWALSFSEEGAAQFNPAYAELMGLENVLPFDRIIITSNLLEQINSKEHIININDILQSFII